MPLRLIRKSITLAIRSRRRFIIFTLMYLTLMGWMCWSFESYWENGDNQQFVYAVFETLVLSILYAWIVINYRKKEIATLKCIGYTNANIRTLIVGELVFVTLISFFVLLESMIHYVAVNTYLDSSPNSNTLTTEAPLLSFQTLMIVLAMFLASQILGILIMYRKILKLRPIVALRILK